MIGQTKLKATIKEQIDKGVFPNFAIIVGDKGQGKKTLSREIVKMKKLPLYMLDDVKVDTIRTMIKDAYNVRTKVCYVIPDADSMSAQAKNALLKVTEEPPNNASFIMTVSDESTLLDTIRSRGTIYRMDAYSKAELREYAPGSSEDAFIYEVCNNMYELDLMRRKDAGEYQEQAEKLLHKVANISIANALKSRQMVAFKDGDDGLDFQLLLRSFECVAINSMNADNALMRCELIERTNQALSRLRVSAINKQSVYDIWIFDLRTTMHHYEVSE